MGKEYALKNIRIKDSKISKISMCGTGGCGLVHSHDLPSCGGGCGLGFVEAMKYLYDKTTSTITPKSKEKLRLKN